MEDTRLGALLLQTQFVPEAELQRCLEIQGLTGGTHPLGQILVEQGVISLQTLNDLLALQAERRIEPPSVFEVDGTDSNRFLRTAVQVGANELVLSEGRPPVLKVGDEVHPLAEEPLAGPEVWQFVRSHMGFDVLELVASSGTVVRDFREPELVRGRGTAFRHFDGLAVTARLHPWAVRTPEAAGIDAGLQRLLREGRGLVLLVGESGAGVTETFASMLHEATRTRTGTANVIDSTFEYPGPGDGSIVSMRRVGEHTRSWASGLRAALREPPEVVFVGGIDDEAFPLALHAAESGPLVVACVRARSAVHAIRHLLQTQPDFDLTRVRGTLAAVLQAVLVVRTVPRADRAGMVLATESLHFDEIARDLVRSGNVDRLHTLMQTRAGPLGKTMDQSLSELVCTGDVLFEDAFVHAEDKSYLLQIRRPEEVA